MGVAWPNGHGHILVPGLDKTRLDGGSAILHFHSPVDRVHPDCERAHVPSSRPMHVAASAAICSILVSSECGVLVDIRVPEPLRAELALPRKRRFKCVGLCAAGDRALFHRASCSHRNGGMPERLSQPVGRVTTLGEIQLVQRSEVGLAAADLFGLCVGRLGAMAKLPVSTRVGRTAFAYHRDPTHSRGGDDLCLCRRRRLAGALGRGIVSIDLRLVLGTLECRELGPLGILDSLCGSRSPVRDADPGVCRLPPIWSRVPGSGGSVSASKILRRRGLLPRDGGSNGFGTTEPDGRGALTGEAPPRVGVRNIIGLLFHEPPRTLLYRPVTGPGGFFSGM